MSTVTFSYSTPQLLSGTLTMDSSRIQYANRFSFTTVYAESYLDWTIFLNNSVFRSRLRGNIEVFTRGLQDLNFLSMCSCRMSLIASSVDEGQKILSQLDVRGEIDNFHYMKFVIRGPNDFTQAMQTTFREKTKSLKIALQLTLPKRFFEAAKWPTPIPTTPLQFDGDETFESLTDTSQHDLKIICPDGEYPTSKAALWRCAAELRTVLEESTTTLNVDVSLQTVKTLVIFMFTRTFSAPVRVDRNLLYEMDIWSRKLGIQGRKDFINALEIFVCPLIEGLRLEDLLELLLLSIPMKWRKIEAACYAIIVRQCYPELQVKYGRNQMNDLASRLKEKKPQRNTSIIGDIEDLWNKQQNVAVVHMAQAR